MEKNFLGVIQAHSLRELVETVNNWNGNHSEKEIKREDVVSLFKDEDTYFLVYFKS